jgi:rhamnose transport system permease protein
MTALGFLASQPPADRAVTRRNRVFFGLTAALAIAVSFAFPGFATPRNVAELWDDGAILVMLALAQMLVILVRGIDLSVAANLALCGMIAATFNHAYPGAGVLAPVLLAIASGALLGAFNGLLVWQLKLPPIVVTLGTMSIYRGVIYLISQGAWVNDFDLSPAFKSLVRATFLGLSTLSWLAIAVIFAFAGFLRFSRSARALIAAGGNPEAARYCGIDAGRAQFLAYLLSGAIAGMCGYLWVAKYAVAYTDIALGFELQVIAACLIGGVAIAGGVGSVAGVVLGCLFIGIIRNALPLVGISAFWQMFINGAVIIAAVLLGARHRVERRATLEVRS